MLNYDESIALLGEILGTGNANALAAEVANDLSDEYAATTHRWGADRANDLADAFLAAAAVEPDDEANALADAYRTRAIEQPGTFIRDGHVYRVTKSRESGRLYAKRLDGDTFVYAAGAIHALNESHRISLDEAKRIGVETGVCVMCGLTLTDEVSIAGGIGPVCEKRHFGKGARSARKAAAKKAAPAAAPLPQIDDATFLGMFA